MTNPSTVQDVRAWLAQRLPELIAQHEVPGAAVAVLAGGEVFDAAAGLLSTATVVEATPDSVFQIGSITKVWTATLVLQLVDEGRVDLDAPVRRYLPEFRIADQAAAEGITVRQLLSHTGGFEGDIFTDTGPGDDCVEKFIATLGDVPQLFAPGEQFSYNNAGYCVLGRLVEVLREKPFDQALRDHIVTPLGLTHVATGALEAIMFRAAIGHLTLDPAAGQAPAPVYAFARSNAPAGSMLAMRPRDLLAFAQLHLNDGVAPDGTQVLSPASVKAMQQRQVELPKLALMGDAWGLGWELMDVDAGTLIGHDGSTIGQGAFLRIVPEQGVAVALVTNGGDTIALYRDLFSHLLGELAGVRLPELPVPPPNPERIDAQRFVGTYSNQVADLVVTQDGDGRIWVEQLPKGLFEELGERAERSELVHFHDDTLIPLEGDRGLHMPHAFLGDDGTGRALYLHVGRAIRRADDATDNSADNTADDSAGAGS